MSRLGFVLLLLVVIAMGPRLEARAQSTPGNEMSDLYEARGFALPASPPVRDEGEGPFERLVIRGATLIDGSGAPPVGPVDIVVEHDRIAEVRSVGYPKLPIREQGRPEPGDYELDAEGLYVLPGFVDAHTHISSPQQAVVGTPSPSEYVFKLWLGHGITTVREIGSFGGLDWTLDLKRQSARNEISAPRIYAYAGFPFKSVMDVGPEEAGRWVRAVRSAGADGIKFLNLRPETMKAALEEAGKTGFRTGFHHAQLAVTRMNVLDTARWGLTSMEHWYGLPEALFVDRTIQRYSTDYNYNNEQHRFGQAGRLWLQAAEPGSEKWNAVIEELIGLDFTIVPTLTIYEASRDEMRARRADWHEEYTWPTLWRFFLANRAAHGAYWFDWTTADEIAWKQNYQRWMQFLNDYKNQGGRVVTGSDSGFIYKVYGFGYIRELELLQEAGFDPLEVVRAATLDGAELLGAEDQIGTVERGKKADMVIVSENPLHNFKVLYGVGARRLNDETQQVDRVGGVKWTLKDGVIYDAKALLADVRGIVSTEKEREAAENEP